jgi:hypothetical protein
MLVAINSGFFTSGYRPHGVAAGGGRQWPDSAANGDTGLAAFGRNRIGLYNAGTRKAWESWMDGAASASHVILSGGRNIAPTGVTFTDGGHPRTAFGVGDGGRRAFFVVVDGRSSSSVGASMRHLGDLMKRLGAADAVNLDGGGSSTFWVSGRGVINRPSDGSERTVANHFGVTASGAGDAPHCPPPPPPPEPQGRRFKLVSPVTIRGEAGSVVTAEVQLKNTGTVAWGPGTQLAPLPRDAASPLFAEGWISTSRISAPSARVGAGESVKLTFPVAMPETPGVTPFPITLVEDGVEWFADALGPADGTVALSVESTPRPALRARIVGVAPDAPLTLASGEAVDVTVSLINTGAESWVDGAVLLAPTSPRGRSSPFAAPSWSSPERVAPALRRGDGTYEVLLRLQAPREAGEHVESFGLVTADGRWFSESGGPADDAIRLSVTVLPAPALRAELVEIRPDLPIRMDRGDARTVEVVLRNTGSEAWEGTARAWLGTTGPRDRESALRHATWPGANRLAPFEPVAGEPGTYVAWFSIRAPEAPGRHAETLGVVTADGRWFADAGGPADDLIRLEIDVEERAAEDEFGPRAPGATWEPFRSRDGCACTSDAPWPHAWIAALVLARVRRERRPPRDRSARGPRE